MSADTQPISPARFAAALKDLSISMLHLKVLEIRNSIAHLQYSNDQLRPFAQGSATAVSSPSAESAEPDQDCVDAIRENEQVIDRMTERLAIIRIEVEDERGVSWTEFMSTEELEAQQEKNRTAAADAAETPAVNGESGQHSAWSDGTFQTGTIRNGQVHMDQQPGRPNGGTLSDEELRRAMEERMRDLGDDDDEGGMHL
ncbi:hypothetical protein S40288_08813 [Stachybotrys chartarum IBT 40288]|nr:hypothetical protein S40288_08813 [Stachybotrys chartarum IBT 40288]